MANSLPKSVAFIPPFPDGDFSFTRLGLIKLKNTQYYIDGCETDADIQSAKEYWEKLANFIAQEFDEIPNEFCYEKCQALTRKKDDQTAA